MKGTSVGDRLKKELVDIFGDRVAFHAIERMLYSSDLGTLPDLVRNLIVTNPGAVVQPNRRDELTTLINICARHKLPLVPRGAGTAGYGGAVPTRGGIVVDFHRMDKIIDINKEQRTTTIEAGVIWNELEAELRSCGLALRLYPGSAISSTVAGWIANGGGAGIGSFEYGYFRDNIIEVELVTPNGIMKVTRDDLDLVDGMAGTTGLISRVTLKVRDNQSDIPVLGAFPNLESLTSVFKELKGNKLALWEVNYRDALHVQLTHQAMENRASEFLIPGERNEPKLPKDRVIATFVYPESRESKLKDRLLNIIGANGGEVLDDALARFEWDERFYPMRLKALGPSIIPSEVIIPEANLLTLVNEVKREIKGLAFNGTLINKGDETVVLTCVLDDERRRGFPLAYSTSFVPIKAAAKFGGRPYSIGMVLIPSAELYFGKNKLTKAYQFKQKIDPYCIMNPGKIFPAQLEKNSPVKKISQLIKLARSQTGIIRATDRIFGGKPPGKVADPNTIIGKLPFGKEAAWDAFACANCGYCRNECTEFKAIGWESASPRGKFHFLREYLKGRAELDERMAEMFFACTTCRRCNLACQIKAPIDEHWTQTLRPSIWQEGFNPPLIFQTQAHNIVVSHNPGGIPQSERKAWVPPDLKYSEEGEIGYWAGCSASFNNATKNLAVNGVRILNEAGIEPAYLGSDEWCCGGAIYLVGGIDEAMETVKHNIDEMNRRGIKTLITSCSGCWLNFGQLYPLFARRLNLEFNVKIRHITEIIDMLIEEDRIRCRFPINLKVTYHDPCHIGRGGGIFEPPRKILRSIPGLELVEMPHNREQAACCGRHVTRYPRLANTITAARVVEAEQTGAQALVSCCPTCENNFRASIAKTGAKFEVLDITDLVTESIGLPTLAVGKLARLLNN